MGILITFTVKDARTEEPIPNAIVSFGASNTVGTTNTTDTFGKAHFNIEGGGPFIISVYAMNFKNFHQRLDIPEGMLGEVSYDVLIAQISPLRVAVRNWLKTRREKSNIPINDQR